MLQTGEDLEVLNTEQQIADAKAEMEEDLEADAALLGLKTKKAKAKPAAEGASGSGEAAAATAEGAADGGDVEMTEAAEEELVRLVGGVAKVAEMDQKMVQPACIGRGRLNAK